MKISRSEPHFSKLYVQNVIREYLIENNRASEWPDVEKRMRSGVEYLSHIVKEVTNGDIEIVD